MTAVVPRTLGLTYGSVSVGGTTDYAIAGAVRWKRSYGSFTMSLRFAVPCYAAVDTAAAFYATCAALEDGFRKPKQTIALSYDSQSHVAYTDGTTAYQIESEIDKVGSEDCDSNRSRLYEVTITGKLGADLTGKDFLRSLSWELDHTPAGVRTLVVSGVYTRNGSTSAYAQYANKIDARVALIVTVVGGGTAWELVGKKVSSLDDQIDECSFVHTYEESIFNQSQGTLNDSEIVRQALSCRRSHTAPGDSPSGARRVVRIMLVYSAWLDKSLTTDLRGKWTSKIKPWLLQVVRDTADSSVIAAEQIVPDFDYKENRVSASIEALATRGSKLLSRLVTTSDHLSEHEVIRKYWKQTGDAAGYKPALARVLEAPVEILRTVMVQEEVVGFEPLPGPGTPAAAGAVSAGPPTGSSGSLSGFGIGDSLSFTQGTTNLDQPGGTGASTAQSADTGTGSDLAALSPGVQWRLRETIPEWTFLHRGQDGMEYDVTLRKVTRVYELLDLSLPAASSGGAADPGAGDATHARVRT